ncbi:MAG: ATP-binding cassette domain-containing protein [Sulfuritalea sp.]|nr:ATP-binding cassette domain-containing protein [Sulfuritalea sp.]
MNPGIDTPVNMVEADALGKEVSSGDGRLVILHEISFRVMAGEAVAIVGASGSGKSTLLGLLAGLDVPSRGRVLISGRDLFALDEDGRAELRGSMLGFVFQSFQLLPALTALENVMLPLELAGRSGARDEAGQMLARVGLSQRFGHYPKHLSGGEQQRVAIARAFAAKPGLLLADEPTGNLDAVTGADIIDLMFAMNAEHGTTLVLVTHDEAIARRCSRVLKLGGGKLVL